MSTEVDNRVVSMQFDNKRFEKNVSDSLSTLDKLKKSLKLDGATKGLQEVDAAAKKVDFSGMSKAVDTVNSRFSALSVMAVTALANILTLLYLIRLICLPFPCAWKGTDAHIGK